MINIIPKTGMVQATGFEAKNVAEVTIFNNFNYNKLIYKLQIIKYQFDKLIN